MRSELEQSIQTSGHSLELPKAPPEVYSSRLEPFYSGSTQLRRIFPGFKYRERRGPKLLSAKADLKGFSVPGSNIKVFSVDLPDICLAGYDLEAFFMKIRGKFISLEGTREGDIDDLNEFIDGNIPTASDIPDHTTLGEYWTEFVDTHLKPIRSAIDEPAPQEVAGYLNEMKERIMDRNQARANFFGLLKRNHHSMPLRHALINNYDIFRPEDLPPDLKGLSETDLLAWIKDARFNEMVSLVQGAQPEVLEELLDWPVLMDKILVDTKRSKTGHAILNDRQLRNLLADLSHAFFDFDEVNESSVVYLGGNCVKISYGSSFLTVRIDGNNVVDVEKYIVKNGGRALRPYVVWTIDEDTGQRVYLNSNIPRQVQGEMGTNTLLGLGLATWLSPSIELPTHLPLPGKKVEGEEEKRMQNMSQIQVIAEASVMRKPILKRGEFFPTIEDFAKKAA